MKFKVELTVHSESIDKLALGEVRENIQRAIYSALKTQEEQGYNYPLKDKFGIVVSPNVQVCEA